MTHGGSGRGRILRVVPILPVDHALNRMLSAHAVTDIDLPVHALPETILQGGIIRRLEADKT